jgi:hypothetical protein
LNAATAKISGTCLAFVGAITGDAVVVETDQVSAARDRASAAQRQPNEDPMQTQDEADDNTLLRLYRRRENSVILAHSP